MPRISYTRNFEDVMIHRCLRNVTQGFYVDVGAYLPVADSNTCALYQEGWRGIVVEPQTRFHTLWHQQRPQDVLFEGVVGDCVGSATFYELDGMEQNATTDAEVLAMHQREGRTAQAHTVAQTTLTALLEQHRPQGDIHLLSVDVEGAEKQVLQGLNLQRFRPWLVVVESTLPNRPTPNHAQWEPLLLAQGYRFAYFDAVNRFYVPEERAELAQAFDHPPCVWDQFVDHRLIAAQQAAARWKDAYEKAERQLQGIRQIVAPPTVQ